MFLSEPKRYRLSKGLPHRRGDVSVLLGSRLRSEQSSPQAWGCFFRDGSYIDIEHVFPTGVGMFPIMAVALDVFGKKVGLPHRRGDVSTLTNKSQRE